MLSNTPKNFRKKLLLKIEEAWDKYPQLRFAQLVVNIIKAKEPCPDIFYIENDVMMYKINAWLSENKISSK